MRQAIPPHSFARPNNALSFHTFIQAEVADGGFDFFDGQFDEALAALDRGTETAASTGESHYRAELYRLRGAVLAETREAAEAASWFQQAIDTARSQQAKSLELRAATSLARLRVGQGQRAEARNLLAPVYGWFTEGFDTADLKEAEVCSTAWHEVAGCGQPMEPTFVSKLNLGHPNDSSNPDLGRRSATH